MHDSQELSEHGRRDDRGGRLRLMPRPAAPRRAACALDAGALSAVNPLGPKAAMLYVLRGPAWNFGTAGDVRSSSAALVAAHNGAAATVTAAAIRHNLVSPDFGGHS